MNSSQDTNPNCLKTKCRTFLNSSSFLSPPCNGWHRSHPSQDPRRSPQLIKLINLVIFSVQLSNFSHFPIFLTWTFWRGNPVALFPVSHLELLSFTAAYYLLLKRQIYPCYSLMRHTIASTFLMPPFQTSLPPFFSHPALQTAVLLS